MQYSVIYKNLEKALFSMAFLILLTSCRGDKQRSVDELAPLHQTQQIVALNTGEGYAINPFTGDSIQPIINSLGDTIITGVPVPGKAKVPDPKSLARPKVIPAGKPEIISQRQTVNKIPEELTVVPVNRSSLKTFTPGSRGDTVPTAVPILATGKVVPCIQVQPVRALPPLMKDNACINIKCLDVEQGMKFTQTTCILEDSRGNIWIGYQGEGLSMYNGETFSHFTQEEGLSDNWVNSILEDSQGNIWIGTLGGVCMYNGESFTHYTQNEGLCHNAVVSILEDSHGSLWFGTWGGGVSSFNEGTFTHFTQEEGLANNLVFSILEDRQGNIWFGTQGGASIYNGLTFRHLLPKELGLNSNWVWSMLEDSRGNIWLGTDEGLCLYNGENLTFYTQNQGLSDNHIRCIQEDSQGNIWFGTHGGVSMYDGFAFTQFTRNEGLSANRIRFIMEDSQRNLWFCTEQGGVSIYYGGPFTHLTRKEGIRETGFAAILEDSHGKFWFGGWGSGVNIYDGDSFMHYTKNEGLISNIIRTFLEDSEGNIWIGTYEGLCKYDGLSFTHFTQDEGLSDNRVRCMLEDRHGNLWFGTEGGGVSLYDGVTFSHFTQNEGLCNNHVNSILEDSYGNIWFSTRGGVSRFDGDSFMHFTEKEGLCHNYIMSTMEDSRGNLWFAMRGRGVCMFDGEKFTYYGQEEGLSNSWVMSIVEDSNNHIWLSTHSGLNRLAIEQRSDSVSIFTYGLKDGLKGMGFTDFSVLSDSKNRIWWGTDKGLTMLDISNLSSAIEPPSMHLNQIDINGQFMDYRRVKDGNGLKRDFNGVASFYNYPLNLELHHKRNSLTFHFSAIDWSASQNLKYSYKMLGLDDQWNAPATEANVSYNNLRQGSYTFKVRAVGAANIWSDPKEYTFRILPPYWFTWWAYLIYGILLLLLVRWYRGFLIKREKVNADLKIKEAEVRQMQELDHMKSRFFTNISHEFRTPLTLIQGPIEELRIQFQGNLAGNIQLFQSVKRNTQRLQELINQLLDISKLETGNVKLQVSRGNLVEFMNAIVLSFLSLADYKKIRYKYKLPEEGEMVYFEADKIEKILTNLISNAFKFTDEHGEISVGIRFLVSSRNNKQESVEIKVSDTGKGIPGDNLDKIFDRFYRVGDPDSVEIEGTGLGLALTKELIDLYRGTISVKSEMGKGSSFTVILPVSVSRFRDEEIVKLSPDENIIKEHSSPVRKHENPDTAKEKATILIVEDNDDLRDYISRILESTYAILLAKNGKEGLDKARENIPDLTICDVMMPQMDGMEMCRLLKTDERTDHIPLIMLTARADRISKLEGLETGADNYLIKPFDMEELKVRVRNLLEQRRKLKEKFRLAFLSGTTDMGLPPKDLFVKRLFDIFNQHLSNPEFKITQLSAELNLSPSQLQRKVMAITGYTPNELLRNHRLKNAAALFRSGHSHVAQVMHRVGFNNQSYFTKCFGKLFKMTPSRFIANCNK